MPMRQTPPPSAPLQPQAYDLTPKSFLPAAWETDTATIIDADGVNCFPLPLLLVPEQRRVWFWRYQEQEHIGQGIKYRPGMRLA